MAGKDRCEERNFGRCAMNITKLEEDSITLDLLHGVYTWTMLIPGGNGFINEL